MTIGSESESSDSRLSQTRTIGQSRYLSRPGSGSESESDSDGLAGPARRRSESDYWPVPGLRDYWPGSESESGETIGLFGPGSPSPPARPSARLSGSPRVGLLASPPAAGRD